jgi:hypothetical protein
MRLFAFLFVVGYLSAAPPDCKTVTKDGTTFRICTRRSTNFLELSEEDLKAPSKEWNGSAWPVTIIDSYFTTSRLVVFSTGISIVASYRDSEKADFTVTYERPHCGLLTHVRRDVPIIIEDGTPSANIDISCLDQPYGLPTVEVKEKGGKKEATHIYK